MEVPHPGGRPRIHNREKIAEDLIFWAQKPGSINLNNFCCHYNPPIDPSKLSHWSKESEEFRQAVNIAKSYIADRREEWMRSNKMDKTSYSMNLTTYDFFVREQRENHARFMASLSPKESESKNKVTEFILVPHDLAIGSKLSTQTLSSSSIESSQQRNEESSICSSSPSGEGHLSI